MSESQHKLLSKKNLHVSKEKVDNNEKDDYLSQKITYSLRGILVVLIIFHHIYQYRFRKIIHPLAGTILSYMGFWCVAIFLFLSGYALTYSKNNKKDYMKTFIKKKFVPLIISYLIFIVIYLIYYKVVENKIVYYTLWYIESTIYMYLNFYISFKNKDNYLIFTIGTLIYLLLCFILNKGISWYATILCFPLGIIWYNNKNRIDNLLNNKRMIVLAITLILFIGTFMGYKYLFNTVPILKNIAFMVSNVLFIAMFLQTYKNINTKNNILIELGKCSLEIYAIQFLYLLLFKNIYIYLYPITVLSLSISSGVLLHHINKMIIKKIIN